MIGDFNARSGYARDYLEDCAIMNELTDEVSTVQMMDMFGIIKERCSMDHVMNNFGRSFIDFCISQRLLVVNGRMGEDARLGRVTCNNVSLVDYVLATPNVFPLFSKFQVCDYTECLSDVHCPIFFALSDILMDNEHVENETESNYNTSSVLKPIWKVGANQNFVDEIDDDKVLLVEGILVSLIGSVEDVTQD
eukprot:GHVL01039036.1.p1 GENE.GHVL01039036.1~~GHVL01039036.1.p1  ORF type:complete len:193 (+),score=26.36 GHVL01039036.1:261-839(+)